jgi:site-specific DNA recombinase
MSLCLSFSYFLAYPLLLGANTKWGVQKRFSQGKPHIPTTYFLGYDTDEDGEIFIDEGQAEIVRRIYKDLLDGRGTPTIAKNLTKEGLKTARGNKTWTSDAVYKILRNEKYTYNYLFIGRKH